MKRPSTWSRQSVFFIALFSLLLLVTMTLVLLSGAESLSNNPTSQDANTNAHHRHRGDNIEKNHEQQLQTRQAVDGNDADAGDDDKDGAGRRGGGQRISLSDSVHGILNLVERVGSPCNKPFFRNSHDKEPVDEELVAKTFLPQELQHYIEGGDDETTAAAAAASDTLAKANHHRHRHGGGGGGGAVIFSNFSEWKQARARKLSQVIFALKQNRLRCLGSRPYSDIPLYPASLDLYHAPYSTCNKLRGLVHFDFEAAAAEQNNSSRRSLTPSTEENILLFFEKQQGHDDATFKKWLQEVTTGTVDLSSSSLSSSSSSACHNVRNPHGIVGKKGTEEGFHKRQNNNGQVAVSLRPSYDDTFVVEGTRVWEHLIPDDRLVFKTEHERSHAVGIRMLSILVAVMEKHNLKTYFLTHGSLLGAYRRGGFVRHDVDIDISMPSSHMNTLRRIWRNEFPRDMFLQSDGTESAFYMWNSRRSSIRVKDRYSCSFGVPTTINQGGKKRMKVKPTHDGFGIDIIPLEKRLKGRQYKILHHYFNTSDILPLSTVCFGGVLAPAPRRVGAFLKTIYGEEFEKNEHVLPAHFGDVFMFPQLATHMCSGSRWSLNWTEDRRGGSGGEDKEERRKCVLWPRGDPNGNT